MIDDRLRRLCEMHERILNNAPLHQTFYLHNKSNKKIAVLGEKAASFLQKSPSLFYKNDGDFYMHKNVSYGQIEDYFEESAHALSQKSFARAPNGEYCKIFYFGQSLIEESESFWVPRSILPYFGFRGLGVHLCAYRFDQGVPYFWLAKRANTGDDFEGLMDNSVAGGVASKDRTNVKPYDVMIKEAFEEASLTSEQACSAMLLAELSYRHYRKIDDTRCDTILCYALELPKDISCSVNDNEVMKFQLIDEQHLLELLESPNNFKFNCSVPWILLLLHLYTEKGVLKQEDYITICSQFQGRKV